MTPTTNPKPTLKCPTDEELNKYFAREFVKENIDERDRTYLRPETITRPATWVAMADFVNDNDAAIEKLGRLSKSTEIYRQPSLFGWQVISDHDDGLGVSMAHSRKLSKAIVVCMLRTRGYTIEEFA